MSHKAIIAKIDRVEEIPGAEKIQLAYVLGEPVVVGKDWGVGYIGVFFPVDLQLSEEYCHENNLFRDATKNKDQTKKGFFENTRRVRAQPFLKVRSCGYFTSLESLTYTGLQGTVVCAETGMGMQFDEIDGHKICQKYISEQARQAMGNRSTKQVKANAFPLFAKHVDSEQFKHYSDSIKPGSIIYFHNKKHGTSFRVGKMKKQVTLPSWKEWVNKIVPVFSKETDYQIVVGTRNVVIENEAKEGFHGSESFRFDVANELAPYMEDGMTIYGEIVGFVNGKPIMPSGNVKALKDKRFTEKYGDTNVFHYGCKEHEFKWHIYRITRLTVDGQNIDLSQKELEKWCDDRGLARTVEVSPSVFYNGEKETLEYLVNYLTEREGDLSADFEFPDMIGEGIILRIEDGNSTPKFFKNKSYAFKVLEGMIEADDMETMA